MMADIGRKLPNRADLRMPGQRITASNVPKVREQGQGVAQSQALRTVPTAGSPAPSISPSPAQPQQILAPGDVPSLEDPTAFPDEPVTAGLSTGPGEGPNALGILPMPPEELAVMRALYAKYGYEEFRRQIDWMEQSF